MNIGHGKTVIFFPEQNEFVCIVGACKGVLCRVLKGGGGFTLFFCCETWFRDSSWPLTNKLRPMTKLLRDFHTPGAHRCPRDSHALIWLIFGSIFPNHLNMTKTVLWSALLVATILLDTYTKFYQNRIKINRVMSKILYAHIWHTQQIL